MHDTQIKKNFFIFSKANNGLVFWFICIPPFFFRSLTVYTPQHQENKTEKRKNQIKTGEILNVTNTFFWCILP